jgi:signal peptidase I
VNVKVEPRPISLCTQIRPPGGGQESWVPTTIELIVGAVSTSGRVFWIGVMLGMAVLVIALPVAVRHRFEGVWIPSTSMAPTLLVGDYVLMDKAAHWRSRGDLVVFTDPGDASETLVKRIVGLAGEEIVVQGQGVYVNCEPADGCRPLAEPYADFSDEGGPAGTWDRSRSRPERSS